MLRRLPSIVEPNFDLLKTVVRPFAQLFDLLNRRVRVLSEELLEHLNRFRFEIGPPFACLAYRDLADLLRIVRFQQHVLLENLLGQQN